VKPVKKAFSEEAPPQKETKKPASSGCLNRMTEDQHTGISWFARWWSIFTLLLILTSSATAGEPERIGLGTSLYEGDEGKAFPDEEPRYTVRFQGRAYHTIYRRQIESGVPIDIYYFRIPPYKGVVAVEGGEELWGRFVRVPSADHFDQSSVVWWHVWWIYENGGWHDEGEKIPPPDVLKKGKSTVRDRDGHDDCGNCEFGINRPGSDIAGLYLNQADPALCQDACMKDQRCKAWTYVKPGIQGPQARCWLKHSVPNPVKDNNSVSGVKDAKSDTGEKVRRGKLGVEVRNLTPDLARALGLKGAEGARVVHVASGGPAEKAGIMLNDVIVSYGGTSVVNIQHLVEMTGKTPAGKTVRVKIVRDGKERTLAVKIGPPGSAAKLPEKETKKPVKKDASEKTEPKKETKKPDVPKEKKPSTGGPPKDLGEL